VAAGAFLTDLSDLFISLGHRWYARRDGALQKQIGALREDPFLPHKAVRSLSDYADPVLRFRDSFPVNRITVGDVRLWPFLRSELTVHALLAFLKNAGKTVPFRPGLTQMCGPENISLAMMRHYAAAYGFRTAERLDVREPVDFLFVTALNSTDRVERNGQIYRRLTDPLYEAALRIGTARKIEIVKAQSRNVAETRRYAPGTDMILPDHIMTTGHAAELSVPGGAEGLLRELEKKIPWLEVRPESLDAFIDRQMQMVNFYGRILDVYRPKVLFFFPYFYNVPLTEAANARGIVTVELQHGVPAGENPLNYDNWQEMPRDGCSALPRFFWVWGEDERERTGRAFGSAGSPMRPQPVVGGYPWLDTAASEEPALLDKVRTALLRRGAAERVTALVTLQVNGGIPDHVADIMNRTGDAVLWVIRRHPKGPAFRPDRRFTAGNLFHGGGVDTAPLAGLFPLIDVHFTESSTALLEADYFGVYNAVWGESGYNNYRRYIDAGAVFYCRPANAEEAVRMLTERTYGGRKKRIGYIAGVDTEAVLAELRGRYRPS
jgi:hypothetical protein